MSHYIYNLGVSLERALASVPTAQPAQVAGYWANREFWFDEFNHLLAVISDYENRLERMKAAYHRHAQQNGGEHNLSEFGIPRNRPEDRYSDSKRKKIASEARAALKRLADRALDLSITTHDEYDQFVEALRLTRN